ncbi:MAG TPA: Uma2 family endonuclease [Xanthobacteraceae bacterium]|nr:Uma2 family endonuclease [Xanthobacteraceae bacterium]
MTVQAPLQPASGTMDVDEFMAFYETRPNGEHWQLIEGVAAMMAPASVVHQRIAHNFSNLLNNAFIAGHRDLFAYIGIGVRAPEVKDFHPEPDVSVVPGVATYDLYSEQFQLVTEILSPSNTRGEIEKKLRYYQRAPHNLYALVIEPREFRVDIYAKSRAWQPVTLTGPGDVIEMPEFGLNCRVVDLYRGTPLDPGRASSVT